MSGNSWGESWGIAGAFAWGDSWGFEGFIFVPPPPPPPAPTVDSGGVGNAPRRAKYRRARPPKRPDELDALEQQLVELNAQAAEVEAAKETQRTIARAQFLEAQVLETKAQIRSLEAAYVERMREYAAYLAEQDDEETLLLLM